MILSYTAKTRLLSVMQDTQGQGIYI